MEGASNRSKLAHMSSANEVDFEFERRTILIGLERRGGRPARRIVQHGGDRAPAHMAKHLRRECLTVKLDGDVARTRHGLNNPGPEDLRVRPIRSSTFHDLV